MLIVCFLRFLLFSIEGRGEGRRILTRVNEEVSCISFARLRYLIVSSGGGETEAMKSGRHFSLNIFDVEVDAVCINLSWLFTYKKLHENTLFPNIYIYILHEPIILSCLPDAYRMGAKIERAFKIVRNPGWRVSLDRSYRECFFTSACKETSEIKWHVEW